MARSAIAALDDLRDFSVTDANHIAQPDRSGSEVGPNPTVEEFVFASLLDPTATVVATTGLMSIKDKLGLCERFFKASILADQIGDLLAIGVLLLVQLHPSFFAKTGLKKQDEMD